MDRRAIVSFVLLLTCAPLARATSVVPYPDDFNYWYASQFDAGDTNVHLRADLDYGYRWKDFSGSVTTKVVEVSSVEKLAVCAGYDTASGLVRAMASRDAYDADVTNVWYSYTGYESLYADVKATFTLFGEGLEPTLDSADAIALWARDDGVYVTAGRFAGSSHAVASVDYRLVSPELAELTAEHRVTIRSVGDVTRGLKVLGFVVFIDDLPAVADAGYALGDDCDVSALLTPEALALAAERRLFLARATPGGDTSLAAAGFAFAGYGLVDEIGFAKTAPEATFGPERVFTLGWDRGVTSLVYTVNGGAAKPVAGRVADRRAAFTIGEGTAEVVVTARYAGGEGFFPNGCSYTGAGTCETNVVGSVTNYSFHVTAGGDSVSGYLASARNEIAVGGTTNYLTFAAAKAAAVAQGTSVISLAGDFTPVSVPEPGADGGCIRIDEGETFTIDLCGHTISNAIGQNATIVNYGNLSIVDSVGGGRVVPYADYLDTAAPLVERTAVANKASSKYAPSLQIGGGRFDGFVTCTNYCREGSSKTNVATLVIRQTPVDGVAEPAFISDDPTAFPFMADLEDQTLYYAYAEPYWEPAASGAGVFVWCGGGTNDRWDNFANWKSGAVPGAGDLAIFPAAATPWAVDFGASVAVTTNFWFDGDVCASGTNDFTKAVWRTTASGRLSGGATLSWTGSVPGSLATLLADGWTGTVAVVEVTSPKNMTGLDTWGNAASTVVLRGVRGYFQALSNRTLPYTLVLENGGNSYAWRNEAGFTGAVLTFAKLAGDGTLELTKNNVANRQTLQFLDVLDFSGLLSVYGKRVVIGAGEVATSEAGSITWSDGAAIRWARPHICRVAAFGGALATWNAAVGTVLAKGVSTSVGADSAVVTLKPYETRTELCTTNPAGSVVIAAWNENAQIVDGKRVLVTAAAPQLAMANSASQIYLTASAKTAQLFADYYDVTTVSSTNGFKRVVLTLNQNAVPVIGGAGESAELTLADGWASVVVSRVIGGFWYGLQYKRAVTDGWSDPEVWTQALPGDLKAELRAPAESSSGFYRVTVRDTRPEGVE